MAYARDPVDRYPVPGAVGLEAATAMPLVPVHNYEHLLNLFFAQSIDGFFFMMLDRPLVWQRTAGRREALEYALHCQRLTKANEAFLGSTSDRRQSY